MFYIFLADGFEEVEALTPLDLMRRAGIDVQTVGVGGIYVTGSHNITVKADLLIDELDITSCDGVVLPGGMPGTTNLYNCEKVLECVRKCADKQQLVCAICAAPLILGRLGLLEGKKAVCFPGFEDELKGAEIGNVSCVAQDNIITAKGAGAVFDFSRAIITYLKDESSAIKILETIQCSHM